MPVAQVVRKHVNSLLLLSLWILSATLFYLMLYLKDFHVYLRTNVYYQIGVFAIAIIGIAAYIVWIYIFIIGVSKRTLAWYQRLEVALEDVAYFFMALIILLLGYMFIRTNEIKAYKVLADQYKKYQQTTLMANDMRTRNYKIDESTVIITTTPFPTKTQLLPTSSPTPQKKQSPSPTPTPDTNPWGIARQIDEHTYTMKIAMDDRMGSAQEIFAALNEYRYKSSREKLEWDDRLAKYAQSRAEHFTKIGQTDAHEGFSSHLKDIENVKALGFWSLGENSSYGYKMYGVHLIEWIYAGDKPHDDNQLNSRWTHVGIGVSDTETDLIFGGDKIQ